LSKIYTFVAAKLPLAATKVSALIENFVYIDRER
jgi:hypothetical protein